MTNRRDVIKGGVAATTALFGAGSAIAATGAKAGAMAGERGQPPVPGELVHEIHDIIYDRQFGVAEAFAAAARNRGLAAHAIEGDVTWLWYNRLDAAWKEGPRTIAGMTGHGALFVLERLAWEKGMVVAFRGFHVPNAKGGIDHRFEGPGSLISRTAQLDDAWAEAMAELIVHCPVKRGAKALLSTSTGGTMDWPFKDEGLVSWIIAPTGRTAFPRT